MNIIEINNLSYSYNNKLVLDNIKFNIVKGSFTSIIGPNGSGKSTLVRILLGLLETDCDITIDNIKLNKRNIYDIRKKIGIVFENPDNQFVAETVMDDIAFSLENMNYPKKEIKKRIYDVADLLNIKDILEREPHTLSGGEKQLVALASALANNPSILIIDEALTMMNQDMKDDVLDTLLKLNKVNELTILNITHDSEELLYCDRILLINKGKLITYGLKDDVFEHDLVLSRNGIKLPFVVDLSLKLKLYGLVNKIYYDIEELVDKIWK